MGVNQALAACRGPAWAIDPLGACIVAANPAGWDRLGLGAGCTGLVLDNRMPVLAQLRRLTPRLEAEGAVMAALEFWTEQGGERLICEVRRLDGLSGTRHLLVELAGPHATSEPFAAPEPHAASGPHAAANDDSADGPSAADAPPVRDDLDTLKEIARRIREGQRQLASRSHLADTAPGRDIVALADTGLDPSTSARAAHELKTPVSAIAAAAEIMRDERLGAMGNDRYKDYAARIAENAHHALAVIDRMLAAGAKSEPAHAALPGALTLDTDAGALCRSVAASVAPLAERGHLEFVLDVGPGLPRIAADETSLRQIVLNLVTNALKFTPPGGRVMLSARLGPKGTLAIEVRDTGKGMTRTAIQRALARSPEAEPEARAGGGYGIGLPLVRTLAERAEATLGIESALGKGTAVTVRFPPHRLRNA